MPDGPPLAAVVTGAARGIGLETSRRLLEAGFSVALSDLTPTVVGEAESLRRQGRQAIGVVADVSDSAQVENLFQRVEDELGPVWLLVNNAGILRTGPVAAASEGDWDLTLAVNTKGVFLCVKAAVPRMIAHGGGRIVNVGSIAGTIVRTNQLAYCAAKAAVNHMTRCLAVELAPYGITVNCVQPGMTDTGMLDEVAASHSVDRTTMTSLIPDGRFARPSDHAALIGWLSSAEAGHVTGQLISVDGGQSLFMPMAAPVGSRNAVSNDRTGHRPG
jgi:NAD(P)-dependent dehydrogenase (short-subunit alcohol dehydrogenase family)